MTEPITSTNHPELHHYTNWKGLKGIIETGTLWATNYRYLNDITEVNHLRSHTESDLATKLEEYIFEKMMIDEEFKRMIRQAGPVRKVATEHSKNVVDNCYKLTFEGMTGPPFARPFIASFCSHSRDDTYEQKMDC